jgi:parvulin-like peptidyl-prolyl isomerase
MRRRTAALASLAFASLLPVMAQGGAAQTMLVDRIVARVNDRIATMVDFEAQLVDRRQGIQAAQDMSPDRKQAALASAGRDVFTEIYQDLLLLSRADQMDAKVGEAEVDASLAQMRERMQLQDDAQFQQALAASGMTVDTLRERMRRNLLVQEVVGREVRPRVKVDDEQQRRYYREHPDQFSVPAAVRMHDIVVLEAGRDPAVVAATAKQIHDEIAGGASMEDVAKKGVAAGTTTDLVDLGWVNAGDLDPTLEKVAWSVEPGGVTAPVHGRGGLHIARVLEKRAAQVRPFDDVKGAIADRLAETKMPEEYQRYLSELEAHSYIALNVPPEAEGFEPMGKVAPAAGDVGLVEPSGPPPVPSTGAPPAPASTPPPTVPPGDVPHR